MSELDMEPSLYDLRNGLHTYLAYRASNHTLSRLLRQFPLVLGGPSAGYPFGRQVRPIDDQEAYLLQH